MRKNRLRIKKEKNICYYFAIHNYKFGKKFFFSSEMIPIYKLITCKNACNVRIDVLNLVVL